MAEQTSQTAQLLPGQSIELSFQATAYLAKKYQVAVDGLTGSFSAVEPLKYGNLRGRVYDMYTGDPLAGVTIFIEEVGESASTNSQGEYGFPSLRVGTYSASFSLAGYVITSYVDNLVIREGENVINVGLVPEPTESGSLSGTVKGSVTGVGVPDVKVTLTGYITVGTPPYQSTQQVYHETFTDAEGRYSFANVLTINYAVTFIKSGYETKVLPVDLTFEPKTLNTTIVAIPGTYLELSFGTPRMGATVWDAIIYDFQTGKDVGCTPSGIKEIHVPCVFRLTSKTFLIRIMTMYWGGAAYWFGPFLVELPELGSYTWNFNGYRGATIDGIAVVELPGTDNESEIVGSNLRFSSGQYEGQWGVGFKLEKSAPAPGKVDAAQYFVGKGIYAPDAAIPLEPDILEPAIPEGVRFTAKLRMLWAQYQYAWSVWDLRRVPEYPPEAYEFMGSFVLGDSVQVPHPEGGFYTKHQVHYAVSGNVSPFGVYIVTYGILGNLGTIQKLIGPCEGTLLVDEWRWGWMEMFAHPNPDEVFNPYGWDFSNWTRIGKVHFRRPYW